MPNAGYPLPHASSSSTHTPTIHCLSFLQFDDPQSANPPTVSFLHCLNKKCPTTSPFQSDPPSISLRSTLYFNLIHPLFKSNPTYDPPSILTRQPHLTSPHLQSTHLRPILYKSRSTSPQTHLAKIHHQTHKQPKCYSHYLGSDLYIYLFKYLI